MSQQSRVVVESPRGKAEMWKGHFRTKGMMSLLSGASVKRRPAGGVGTTFRVRGEVTEVADMGPAEVTGRQGWRAAVQGATHGGEVWGGEPRDWRGT